MKLVVITDKQNGVLFNNRRQSQDEALVDDLINRVESIGKRLWVSEYSFELFKTKKDAPVTIANDDFSNVGEDDFVFIESRLVNEFAFKADELYIYKWNKFYPSDVKLDVTGELLNQFEVVASEEFGGDIHDTILLEIWRKVD